MSAGGTRGRGTASQVCVSHPAGPQMSTSGPLRYQLLPLPCPLTAASCTVAMWSPWHRSPTPAPGPGPQFTACPRPDTSATSPSRMSGAGGPNPSHRGSHLSHTCRRPPCVRLKLKASGTPRGRAFAFLTGAARKGRDASRRLQPERPAPPPRRSHALHPCTRARPHGATSRAPPGVHGLRVKGVHC